MKLKILYVALLCYSLSFAQTIALTPFAEGFTDLVEITHAGTNRMYAVQQTGQIKIVEANGTTVATPYLDIASLIKSSGEQGFLGLAFHPNYATNGYLYVNYINKQENTVIARYTRSATNPNVADPASALVLLTVDQPASNHNGGCMRFGPDGYLYISLGDGGGAGDPNGNGQNINTLLGKLLRIDVNSGSRYGIPSGNPFATTDGADEIWATGLRNAWKFSFTRNGSDLWIADVGQDVGEEINKVNAATPGLNFGWKCYEGTRVFSTSGCAPASMFSMPFAEYTHAATGGCSITGGFVYTGTKYPKLTGKYLFADFCSNKIGMLDTAGAITWTPAFAGNSFTTFGEDIDGELYIAGGNSGKIYRITDSSVASADEFSKSNITMYPNPASNELFIDFKNGIAGSKVIIYDLGGKLLLQQNVNSTSNTINTSALQAGLYFVEVSSTNGKLQQKLVIN